MLKEKDMLILREMRKDSRSQLKEISKETGVPITTVFERLKHLNKYITKNTSLLDFSRFNYPLRVVYIIKIDDTRREEVKNRLMKESCINNMFRSGAGFSFIIEAIFKDLKEESEFSELITSLKPIKKIEHQLIEEMKKEEFLTT